MIKIKVKEIINLFDTRENNLQHNISTIINLVGEDLGAALFKRYFEKTYDKKVEIISRYSPVSGTKKGPWLDRWIYIYQTAGKKIIAYQTEIKNWSAYAIGGRPININNNELSRIASLNWEERRNQLLAKPKNGENKVFYHMKRPDDLDEQVKIEPLIIYWMVLSKTKNDKSLRPFFKFNLPAKIRGFKKLNVFSMSNYLRLLRNDELILDMPNAQKRISLLRKYFRMSKI